MKESRFVVGKLPPWCGANTDPVMSAPLASNKYSAVRLVEDAYIDDLYGFTVAIKF